MRPDRLDDVMRQLAAWAPAATIDRSDLSTDELLSGARAHRLIGVLAAAASSGSVRVDPADRSEIEDAHVSAMAEALLLEDDLLDAVEVLGAGGIDYRVMKGSALAHTLHPDPAQRCFGDTDLLVRSRDVDRAVELLNRAGARRRQPPLAADWDRRFAKSVTFDWSRGTELDVHRTLAPGAFGLRIRLDDLWRAGDRFVLAGEPVETLSPELHFLNGVYHVALGDPAPRYGNLRDLVLLLRSGIDLDAVTDAIERWRGRAVLEEALRRLGAVDPIAHRLAGWVARHPAPARDRRLLRAHRVGPARFRRQALGVVRDLPWRDRLAYARAVVVRPGRRR